MKHTIYLADDEANIRDLMKMFLLNGGYAVQAFASGDELMEAFRRQPADLVILDVMMPGTDGLALCTQIRRQSNALIVIVSARDSELDRIAGITLGSDDYLTKPFSPMELVARVNALFRRMEMDHTPHPAEEYRMGDFRIDGSARRAYAAGKALDLTPTEYELMRYLLQNGGRAVSREELLRNVWKFDFEVDTRATDDVIKRLRRKLAVSGTDLRIDSVWGFGFRLTQESAHADD